MPEDRRFSHVYLERGAPAHDSERMRRRLGRGSLTILSDRDFAWAHILERELGVEVPGLRTGQISWLSFFLRAELRDVLDAVTVVSDECAAARKGAMRARWLEFVGNVFREENMNYRVEPSGRVLLHIDEEHQRNRASSIAALDFHPAALEACQLAFDALDRDPADTRQSVRAMFEACEILFKAITGAKRLSSQGVVSELPGILQQATGANDVEQNAFRNLISGMCDWIDAGHLYRHGQDVQDPAPPSLGFAALFLSQGGGYIRLLADVANARDELVSSYAK